MKCVSGQSSTKTAALTLWTAKKIASSFGTLAHRFSTNTCLPVRVLCRAKAGTQKMPRKSLVFYSEPSRSSEIALRHRFKFSIKVCQSQIKVEPIGWDVMLWKVKGRHRETV